MSLEDRYAGQMGQLLGPDFPTEIGLAVSGGGDSMAMLALTHGWARTFGVGLRVATIDHGLRAGSRAEAVMVAEECATLGHSHDILDWAWDGQGNLQDAARRARLALLGRWRGAVRHVLFAHTRDDQAETLLMRLIRGSGVDGLAAMAPVREVVDGSGRWHVVRPLLEENRADLRHYIRTLKVPFANDPTNDDPSYDRVRVRQAIRALELDHVALAETAARMRRARGALQARVVAVAREVVVEATCQERPTGDLLIDRDGFAGEERDTQLRLMAAAVQWVAGAEYRPRARALEGLLDGALAGSGGTLQGARVWVEKRHLRIGRELKAMPVAGDLFDGRWRVSGDGTWRALGEDGWRQLADKPADVPPAEAGYTLPALFSGGDLIACPTLAPSPDASAEFHPPFGPFVAFLESR